MAGRKGQLELIEAKYFIFGLLFGIIAGLVLIKLGMVKVLPFKIPFVCG
jgi:hypothetical protein